jgi:hypothetical protein
MKRLFFILFVASLFCTQDSKAQYGFDDMVELTGVIMSSDSLRYLPYVSIKLAGTNQGVVSNKKGVFSVIAPKGTKLEFSCMGYKKKIYALPDSLSKPRYSIIQLMTQDTFYLPVTVIRPVMSREEFERAFVKLDIPPDRIEMARRNTSVNTMKAMAFLLPKDGNEHLDYYQKAEADRLYWKGGAPPGGISALPGPNGQSTYVIDPLAFAEFFKAWKRGDFKRQK